MQQDFEESSDSDYHNESPNDYRSQKEILKEKLNRVEFMENANAPYPRSINHYPDYAAAYDFPETSDSVNISVQDSGGGEEENSEKKQEALRLEQERLYREKIENERLSRESARHVLTQYFRRLRRKWHKESEWYLNLTFPSYLPDPLGGPVYLNDPLSVEKLSLYKASSIEVKHKPKLKFSQDLGVDINLIDERSYMCQENPDPLHQHDIDILMLDKKKNRRKERTEKKRKNDEIRARRSKIDLNLSWIMRTTYITKTSSTASRVAEMARFKKKREDMLRKKAFTHEEIDRMKIASRSFIEATSRDNLVHPTKPDVTVEWEFPIFPDENLLKNTYTDCVFESDPITDVSRYSGSAKSRQQRVNTAFIGNIRRVTKRDGEDYICGSYLVRKKLQNEEEEEVGSEHQYSWIKDYKIQVSNFLSGRDDEKKTIRPISNAAFIINEATKHATFCPLSARINISHLPAENIVRVGKSMLVKRKEFQETEEASSTEKKKRSVAQEATPVKPPRGAFSTDSSGTGSSSD